VAGSALLMPRTASDNVPLAGRGSRSHVWPLGRLRFNGAEDAVPVSSGCGGSTAKCARSRFAKLGDESRLEAILERDVSILGLDVMVIGRQVRPRTGSALICLRSMPVAIYTLSSLSVTGRPVRWWRRSLTTAHGSRIWAMRIS